MWLALAIGGYTILAVVTLLDKFILSSKAVKPLVFVFYSSVFLLPLVLLLPFGVNKLVGLDWLIALISGAAFVLALWTSYISFVKSEVSHAGPLIGAGIPLFILVLNQFFLGETFTNREFIGIGFLVFGCLMISFEKSRAHSGWHSGFLWAILAAFFYAVSHLAAKEIYNEYDFYSGLVWTRLFIGVTGMLVLLSTATRQEIFGKNKEKQKSENKLLPVVVNKVLSVFGVVLVQYAIAIGSVVIVNALLGVQYALLIMLVALLSKFYPRIFKEEYTKGEIIQELSAVILIAAGLVFLL